MNNIELIRKVSYSTSRIVCEQCKQDHGVYWNNSNKQNGTILYTSETKCKTSEINIYALDQFI